MAYELRIHEPERVYFITTRCLQRRFLLRPSTRVNQIIGSVIARALALFGVELFAFTFVSNHYHALVRAPQGLLSAFIGYVNGNIGRKVGKEHKWDGRFWHCRFSSIPVMDDEALVERLGYILAHGVKENLVSSAEEWPGLTSIPELVHGHERQFPWVSETKRSKAQRGGKPVDEADFTTLYPLKLTVLPGWEDLSPSDRRREVKRIIAEVEAKARADHAGKPCLGVEAVLSQDPRGMPEPTESKPRPLCHASTRAAREAYRQLRRTIVAAYRHVSRLFRAGDLGVEFPPGTFRPPLPFGWTATAPPVATAA